MLVKSFFNDLRISINILIYENFDNFYIIFIFGIQDLEMGKIRRKRL